MSRAIHADPPTCKTPKVKLNVEVDPGLRSRFKASCNVHGKTMNDRIAEVMQADADAAGIPVCRPS